MSKDKYSELVFISNEDFAAASLIYLYGDNIEEFDKQEIGTNI